MISNHDLTFRDIHFLVDNLKTIKLYNVDIMYIILLFLYKLNIPYIQ